MKPLMLIPPAQAEALYDSAQESQPEKRMLSLPWLDDEGLEEAAPSTKMPYPDSRDTQRLRAHLRTA